jgi:hypothetical protein
LAGDSQYDRHSAEAAAGDRPGGQPLACRASALRRSAKLPRLVGPARFRAGLVMAYVAPSALSIDFAGFLLLARRKFRAVSAQIDYGWLPRIQARDLPARCGFPEPGVGRSTQWTKRLSHVMQCSVDRPR